MAATTADLSKLRRMIAEPTTDNYSDAELVGFIESYPLTVGYDLNAAAAEVWGYKAAAYLDHPEQFSADGSSFTLGKLHDKALAMQRHYSGLASETYSEYGFGQFDREDISEDAQYHADL